MKQSRLFNTVRNISWRFIVLFMTAIANLIIPRYVMLAYGSEVNGLTSSIAHVLSLVNLVQAGLGSSVTYMLYKPIEEKDRVALASIISSARRIYGYISVFVMAAGTIASFIFAYVVKTDLERDFVLIASLITCIDSATSTYFTAAGNVFLGAKQDGYLTSRVTIIASLCSYALRIPILIFRPHYITLFLSNLVTCTISIIGIRRCFRKQYKAFEPTPEEKKLVHKVPIRGVSYAAANEAAHAIVTGSITVIISMVAGLKASSVFAVYMLTISALSTFSNAIYSAVVPSYGSVAAEGNMEKTNRIFEIYQFVLFTINAVMYMCAAYLMIPFVKLYTHGISDAEYTNVALMLSMVGFGIVSILRIPYNNTVYIRGLFKQTWLQPVICAVISVAMMVELSMVDYSYTLLGAIFFFGANTLYQHFKLPKLFPGFDNRRFWNHLAVIAVGLMISVVAYILSPIAPTSFFWWIVCACITGVVSILVVAGLVLLLDRKSLKLTLEYLSARTNYCKILALFTRRGS